MRGNRIESDQWRLIVRARHNSDSSVPAYQYELPDCSVIELTTERHRIPETLFDPSQLQRKPTDAEEIKPIQQMIFDSISVCDVDVRKELFNSINVSGGSTLFPKFVERLNREVSLLAPQQVRVRAASEEIVLFIHSLIHSFIHSLARLFEREQKVKILSSTQAVERKYAVWIGGSILGSLGSFQKMWMSKSEYEERGKSLVERKCA